MTGLDEQVNGLLAERDCQRLVHEYAWLVDSGAASGVADLFTDDGVWLGADGRGMQGQEEIRRRSLIGKASPAVVRAT
jgi:uncharacterized protein (TIGR02246 family)